MEVGHTRDAGWEIGVSRTLPQAPDTVWALLTGPEGLALWLGPDAVLTPERGAPYRTSDGTVGQVRSYRPHDRVRLTWRPPGWDHDSTVQVAIVPASGNRTSVRFHQERLSGPQEREEQRAHWRAVLDAIEDALAQAP